MKNEDLISIGKNIKQHRDDEISFSPQYTAIARANCTMTYGSTERSQIIWLAISKNNTGIGFQSPYAPEISIAKNSILGGAIIARKDSYELPKTYTKCSLDIYNFTSYTPSYGSSVAKDLTVEFSGDNNSYKYQTIAQLLSDANQIKERLKKEAEEKKRLEEARLKAQQEEEAAREAARKAAEEEERKRLEEEAKRLEELRKQKEEEERKKAEEIERLEGDYNKAQELIVSTRNFIRNEATLRSQHILDPSQEDAKRSHLYDGVPMVIEVQVRLQP